MDARKIEGQQKQGKGTLLSLGFPRVLRIAMYLSLQRKSVA